MNDEKFNGSLSLEDESQSNRETRKRISYVSRDLASMIEFVSRVYTQLGHAAYHSNKAIATIHGLSPDSIKQQLTSSQQYNLLELKHGVGYKVTDHFQKIYLWKSESEKRVAIIESLKFPETYHQLFKDYEYHVVPPDGVKNHFIRSFGFKEDIAAKATQIFLENLKEYDLLDSRNVLISALPTKAIIPEIEVEVEEQNARGDEAPAKNEVATITNSHERQRVEKVVFQSELDMSGKKTVPIYLIGSKQAWFVYPDDITVDEIELVKHQIEGVLLRIKIESRVKEQAEKQG